MGGRWFISKSMIQLDSHPAAALTGPYDVLEGWLPCPEGCTPRATLGGLPIALHGTARPDLPPDAFGFCAYGDGSHLVAVEGAARLSITIEDGETRHVDLAVPSSVREAALAARAAKEIKRDWLSRHLKAPGAHAPLIRLDDQALAFEDGRAFDQAGYGAVNVLDPAFGFTGRLTEKTDGVSAHPYPTLLEKHLSTERARVGEGFMALDFGAGVKAVERADVIYLEVFDYPSTDLLSVGQALPFADATFDMVCTLAVLEHVDDPFACAAEIVRVLKPGGLLFSGIPFMQPEHGYPDHFFNATRSGHRKLYGEAIRIVDHLVDDHQHPWLSLQWFLGSYAKGLEGEARAAFRSMTVEEILGHRYWRHRDEPRLAGLGDDARWELASATTLVGRRR